jgi:hypothetical protein
LDGDDTLLVQPYALEDKREELALGGRGRCDNTRPTTMILLVADDE